MSAGRRGLQSVLLTFAATLVVVVGLEGALRLAAPSVAADPDSGPTLNVFTQSLPGVKSSVRYERNGLGLRALTMSAREKAPGTLRVLCLGASTTDQATQSTADTWCGLLETGLRSTMAARGVTIETASRGRPGHGAADVARWARQNVAALRPDLVITLLGINDLAFAMAPEAFGKELERGVGTAPPLRPAGPNRPSISERCRQVSQLCARLALARARLQQMWQVATGRALEWHSSQLPALRTRYQAYPHVAEPVRAPDPVDGFAEVVGGLLDFLRAADIPVLVLGQPVLWKPDLSAEETGRLWFPVFTADGPVRPSGEWLQREMRRFNAAQQREAAAFGATYLDLDSRIPKTLEYFFDDCHYTDAGSRRISEEVLPKVREMLGSRLSSSSGVGPP